MGCPAHLLEFDTDVPDPGRRGPGDGLNDKLLAALLRHRHWMLMAENGVVRDVVQPIREAKRVIARELGERVGAEGIESFRGRRLRTLERRFEEIITIAESDSIQEMRRGLQRVSQRESEILTNILDQQIPDSVKAYMGLNFAGPSAEQIRTLVEEPLGGKRWSRRMERNFGETLTVMKRELGTSIALGEGMPKAARRLRGTVDKLSMQRATRIARTEIQRVSNEAAIRTYRRNQDVIKGLQWTSVLDDRTCFICMGLDGETFETGNPSERPPAHPACRCILSPVTRSFEELGLPVDEFPPTTRASMNGQVPATLTYEDWFAQQGQAFQRKVLGPSRFELFKQGDLTLNKMATNQRILPLDELPDVP